MRKFLALAAILLTGTGASIALADHEGVEYDAPPVTLAVPYDPPAQTFDAPPETVDPPAETSPSGHVIDPAPFTFDPAPVVIDPDPVSVEHVYDAPPVMVAIPHETAPDPARSVILENAGWVCRSAVDLDLVRVTNPPGDAISLAAGCSGVIDRVEVVTSSADGIKVQNSGEVARDIVIGGGFIRCDAAAAGVHQDGIQAMGGSNILFRGLTVDCPFSNSHLFIARGGAGASTPTDVICDGCFLGSRAASHTALFGTSLRSGARNSTLCPDRTGGDPISLSDATEPVDVGNIRPASC